MTDTEARLGAGRFVAPAASPADTTTTVHLLGTTDGAAVTGLLRTVPGAQTVMAFMHPRQDLTHHPLVPEMLARGFAVWTQGTRSVNNDLALIHEQALLDVAAGQVFLRESGFEHVVTFGHSGGGPLFAFYHQQACLPPSERISRTPAGRPVKLGDAAMPVPDAAAFMAPHPGQGQLLLRLIDPSVTDEADPLSIDPSLDPYSPDNGFAPPGQDSTYSDEFARRYRLAQLERIQRLDARARELAADAAAARARFKQSGDPVDRRAAVAPRVVTAYRTDADLRSVSRQLDANARPYGSLFGARPDLTNFGLIGFGRSSTPDAWLSTWSANTTNADFVRNAPGVTAPTILVELTGDQACFPADAAAMEEALGADDLIVERVAGTHFGGPLEQGGTAGSTLAGAAIGSWLIDRFPAGKISQL